MAEWLATRSSRGHRTICLPIAEESYRGSSTIRPRSGVLLDDCFRATPELFPPGFARGYELKDGRTSVKRGLPIRRILMRDGTAYSIRPSFLMPYMTARIADVEGPLFLRNFGVPFWALARVFGRDPMYWYRLACGLGRSSVAGATVRRADMPEHLLADEHHRTIDGAEGLPRHDRRRRLRPGRRARDGRRDRRADGRLRGLPGRGPRRRPEVAPGR